MTGTPSISDGKWGAWTAWGVCSAKCAGGTQERTRKCNSPAPNYGGKACVGSGSEKQSCATQPCPHGNTIQSNHLIVTFTSTIS